MPGRYIPLFGFFLYFLLLAYNSEASDGVHFAEDLSWAQIQAKAKAENKFIFVECMKASRCEPCIEIEKNTFQSAKAGDYVNQHFISIQMQMDSTDDDNTKIRNLYLDARLMMVKYNVHYFPTFLFFSPDGQIVHKDFGYLDSLEFFNLIKNALDVKKQYYTVLENYKLGRKNYLVMPYFLGLLEKFGETELVRDISRDLFHNYLSHLGKKELYTKENIEFLHSFVRGSKEWGFNMIYGREKFIDLVMRHKGYADLMIEKIIFYEEVFPQLWENGLLVKIEPKWDNIFTAVKRKYNRTYAKWVLIDGKIRWYTIKKDWQQVVKYRILDFDRVGLDTSDRGMRWANDVIYSVILMHSNDRIALRRALHWQKVIIERYQDFPAFLDTYANLLYKLGNKKDALDWENRACLLDSRNSVLRVNYYRMLRGEPNWPKE